MPAANSILQLSRHRPRLSPLFIVAIDTVDSILCVAYPNDRASCSSTANRCQQQTRSCNYLDIDHVCPHFSLSQLILWIRSCVLLIQTIGLHVRVRPIDASSKLDPATISTSTTFVPTFHCRN